MSASSNITWHAGQVARDERQRLLGHRSAVLWLTGLSGSGKSSVAHALERALIDRGCIAYVLDGDNVRHGLSSDLGFSPLDRSENIRRIGEVAKLFLDAGVLVVCAFVSPYRADRKRLRDALPAGDFVEVYIKASLETCRARDPKGLYGRADSGAIQDLTGVDAPYEPPDQPELVLDTERHTLSESVEAALGFLQENGYIPTRSSPAEG